MTSPFPPAWKKTRNRCILADPPWQFRDTLDKTRTLARHYETMDLGKLAALPVWEIADDDSVLLLWCPASMMWEGYVTMTGWGFAYKTMFVWIKPRIGLGHYFRTAHECLLLGVRGHPKVLQHSQPSWIMAPVQEHSHKPEEVYAILERMFEGPRAELFCSEEARRLEVMGQAGAAEGGMKMDGGTEVGGSEARESWRHGETEGGGRRQKLIVDPALPEPGPSLFGTGTPYDWLLDHSQLFGVPLRRVLTHPAFLLGMRGVVLGEGGNPDDWAGLRLSAHTRLLLVAVELEGLKMEIRSSRTKTAVRDSLLAVREAVALMEGRR